MQILLVADNLSEAKRLTRWLSTGLGPACHVQHLTDLQEALSQLRDNPGAVDVLLVDLIIPPNPAQLHGLTVAQETAPFMAIIVISELTDDDVVRTAIRSGAQEFLVKEGLTAKRLATIVTNVIQERRRWYDGIQRIQKATSIAQQAAALTELSTAATQLLARLAEIRGLSKKDTMEEIIQTATDQEASTEADQSTPEPSGEAAKEASG